MIIEAVESDESGFECPQCSEELAGDGTVCLSCGWVLHTDEETEQE